jgi:hypothetical protein
MQELSINALAAAKQPAKGTAATTGHKRLVWVNGDIELARDDGSEEYSDLGKYGSATDWINSVTGSGTPGVEGTPEELAALVYWFEGGETTTAVTGPPAKVKHTFVPLPTPGFWTTWFRRVGASQVQRQNFVDSRIGQIVVEGSTAQKAVRITPSVMSLDPGVVVAADPTAPMPTKRPFIYTEGSGTFTIDTLTFRGHSQFTFTSNADLSTVFGDDTVPYDVVTGNPAVTIGCTIYMDAEGLAEYNRLVYGTATPTAGAKPRKTVPPLGSYEFTLTARDQTTGLPNGDEFHLLIPGVKWAIPNAPAPASGGGSAELAMSGAMRVVPGQPAYQLDVTCDSPAFT